MDVSRILSILIQATFITLIYLFLFLTAKLFFFFDDHQHVVLDRASVKTIDVSWNDFVSHSKQDPLLTYVPPQKIDLRICNSSVVNLLSSPRLSTEEYNWCLWAKSSTGGNVSPSTFWGNLKSKADRNRYHALQCSELHSRWESCADVEGDSHIRNWKRVQLQASVSCDAGRTSSQRCYQNNSDLFCEMTNVMIDFSKSHNATRVSRFGETLNIKSFDRDFMSSDCTADVNSSARLSLPISHLYSTQLSSKHCDVVLSGPVLLYSHDYLENYGHTLNDFMNVWRMLWLSGLAAHTKDVDLLNVDGMFGSRSYNEKPNPWFRHYYEHFRSVLMGIDFANKTVCIKKLFIQPVPNEFFVFKYWHADDKCGLHMGPSSLFQRYNLHVRGLFSESGSTVTTNSSDINVFRIVVIVRKERDNLAGTASKTSRLMLNLLEIRRKLSYSTAMAIQKDVGCVEVEFQDLSELTYGQQLMLIGRTNILVGMHGAGIPQSMHMSIGTRPNCCGVIEIFPAGEFTIIRAHGNMVRRMGLKYDRIDISVNDSHAEGAVVPVEELSSKLVDMARLVQREPTCVLPSVIEDPYLLA